MLRLLFLFLALAGSLMATDAAFPQSPVGTPELKTLPSGTLLKSAAPGSYFEQSNRLFRPLFRYISSHDIAMTVPVEAQIDGAAMFFWVSAKERAKVTGSGEGVDVIEVPERRVASLGGKGSYSAENFAKTAAALTAWLKARTDVESAGPAYAVYWNGPFTPGFLKRYEVHIPVRTTGK